MRKVTAIFLSLLLPVFFTVSSYAKTASGTDNRNAAGNIEGIKHSIDDEKEKVTISMGAYSDYSIMRLKTPDRVVIDISNVNAPGKQQKLEINSSLIKTIRYAQFDTGISRVVIDTNGQPEYQVEKNSSVLTLYIYDPEKSGKSETDENNKQSSEEDQSDTAGEKDLNKSAENIPEEPAGDTSEAPAENAPEDPAKEPALSDRGVDRAQKVSVDKNFFIEYLQRGSMDEVAILLENYKDYNIMRLTGPDRIVIDIPDAKAPGRQQIIDINSNLIKTIRYAQFEKNIARVVLDVTGQSQFQVNENKGRLILNIENPAYSNFTYQNNSDRVFFTIEGAKLTEGRYELKKFYTGEYDSTGKKYTITFPSELADLNSGTLNINDGLLNSVEIVCDKTNKTTSITFDAKAKYIYQVIARPEVNNTTITVIKPASISDKLVVIDAGHGGTEPGAIYGSIKEKDINLDIALKLNELLKDKKVKTYMTREDDSFVGLYERTHIANNLNAALFLSIHNNAMADPDFGGTMTLYFPQRSSGNDFNGKAFAQLVQNALLKNLGTRDRKIVERPNLVVLKETKMPAALAEIAFLTNSGDRKNLQSTSFRQNAAEALCEAVIEALEKIK